MSGAIEPVPTTEVFVTEGEVPWEPTEEPEQEIQPTPTARIEDPDQFELMGDFPDPDFMDND